MTLRTPNNLRASGLADCAPEDLHALLSSGVREATDARYKGRGVLSLQKFLLLLGASLEEGVPEEGEDIAFLRNALISIFEAYAGVYEVEDEGCVLATPLICGVSVFALGSKSTKLELAFQTMCDDFGTAALNLEVFAMFLSSFLSVIMAVSRLNEARPSIINNACRDAAEQVFTDLEKAPEAGITFEEFATWYSQHQWHGERGFVSLTWLELLDLRKWGFMIED